MSWIKETRYLCWEILNLNNNCKPSFLGWVIGFLIRGSLRVDSFPDAGRCWYEGPGLVFPLNPYGGNNIRNKKLFRSYCIV